MAAPWRHIGSSLSAGQLAGFSKRLAARFELIERARRDRDEAALAALIPAGERFAPTASSITVGVALNQTETVNLLSALSAEPVGECARDWLGGPLVCDVDQSWVRRQYAPAHYPPLHAPHSWHQDGALGFNFLAHPEGNFPPDALLPMVTCWIALTPFGDDAPGLELVTRRFDELLAPVELVEPRVRSRFAPEDFKRPVLAAGDALLFRGDILHRTHVTPAMTRDRTSLELRFFAAESPPERLARDRFIRLG